MNAKTLLSAALLASALPLLAQEAQPQFDLFAPVQATRDWKPNPALWQQLLSEKRDAPLLSVGGIDVTLRGPLVDTFRRPPAWQDLSLGERIIALPIINLFVPLEMPKPPGGGGKYFVWGESRLPWTTIAQGSAPGEVRFYGTRNGEYHGLISFGW